MRRPSGPQALQQLAKVGLPDDQLSVAGEIDTPQGSAQVYALKVNQRHTWLLVSAGDRLVVLSDPGLLLEADRSVARDSHAALTEVFKDVEPEDLIKFGLIPELVGRMPVVATLAELSEDALVQILIEPKNALVKQYAKLFSMEGVDLEIRPSALKAIARKALARKTGARGLRSILEQSLIDTMFELPNAANVDKVVVDESTIEENKRPLLVYRELAKKA